MSHTPPSRIVVLITGFALLATVAAACGSSSASPKSTKVSAAKQFLSQSGTGDKVLTSVTLPKAWTTTWNFDCQTPSAAGNFVLTSTKAGGAPVSLTNQTGLGGGGHKPSTSAGKYSFNVETTCGWKVSVASTPAIPTTPPKSAVTTTTTVHVKKASTKVIIPPVKSSTSTT
jgi:hypothetical protein